MTLKQLENLVTIDEDITNPEFGVYYDKRSIEQLLEYGLILVDKPCLSQAFIIFGQPYETLSKKKVFSVYFEG